MLNTSCHAAESIARRVPHNGATRTRSDAALELASGGFHVHPLHWIEDGHCSCGADDCKAGKHPHGQLVPHGDKDATTDPATIQQWWAVLPDCNIGISADQSGLIVIGPDCANRLADFEQRGLPDTMIVESGSGHGHRHYYYRRPDDCPATKINKPGDFDILAVGNIVAPGSVTSGRYRLLTPARAVANLPFAPDWAVAMLRHAAERAAREATPAASSNEGPPVRLGTYALQWWNGERRARDRSGTLIAIAKELYRAGATAPTIAVAIADRDVALALHKYTGRNDAATRYRVTAQRAAAQVENEPTITHIPQSVQAPANDAHLAALETEVIILKEQVARLTERADRAEELQRLTVEVLRNPDLKNMKATALAVVFTVGGIETSGKPGQYYDITEDGYINVRRAELADKAGVKEDAITRHVTKLEAIGNVLEKRVQRVKKVDRETGEILKDPETGATLYDSKLQIKLSGDTRAVLRRLAEPFAQEHKSGWGGERERPAPCEQHPDAAINVYRVLECAECEEEIGRSLTDRHPATLNAGDSSITFDVKPQDDVSDTESSSVDSVLLGGKMQFQEQSVPTCRICQTATLLYPESIERGTCASCESITSYAVAAGGAD